jgi:hypothetical protein
MLTIGALLWQSPGANVGFGVAVAPSRQRTCFDFGQAVLCELLLGHLAAKSPGHKIVVVSSVLQAANSGATARFKL